MSFEKTVIKGNNKYKEMMIAGLAYKLIKADKNNGFLNLAFQEKRTLNLVDKYIKSLIENVINQGIVSPKSKIRILKGDLPIIKNELSELNIDVIWK
jgi:hypothetical protein